MTDFTTEEKRKLSNWLVSMFDKNKGLLEKSFETFEYFLTIESFDDINNVAHRVRLEDADPGMVDMVMGIRSVFYKLNELRQKDTMENIAWMRRTIREFLSGYYFSLAYKHAEVFGHEYAYIERGRNRLWEWAVPDYQYKVVPVQVRYQGN